MSGFTHRRESEDAERIIAGDQRDGSNTKLTDDGVTGRDTQLHGVLAVRQRQSRVPHRERRRLSLISGAGAEPHRPRRPDKVDLRITGWRTNQLPANQYHHYGWRRLVNAYGWKQVWCVCSVKAVWSTLERFRSDAFQLRCYTNVLPLHLSINCC